MSIGFNQYTIYDWSVGISTHAEVNAINKLPSIRRRQKANKMKYVDIYVIRVNKTHQYYMSSKPCTNCQYALDVMLKKRGYKVSKIYHS